MFRVDGRQTAPYSPTPDSDHVLWTRKRLNHRTCRNHDFSGSASTNRILASVVLAPARWRPVYTRRFTRYPQSLGPHSKTPTLGPPFLATAFMKITFG
jgi:hypothetical protein